MDKIILNRPERRRFTRINCSLPIKFVAKSGIGETDSDSREYDGWGRNISEGGIYIEAPNLERRFLTHLSQSRCKIELKIYLFGQDNHVLTQGEIIWTEEEGLGFTVQFAQINECVKDRIKSYISKGLVPQPKIEDLEKTQRQSIKDITFPIKLESSIIVKQPKETVYNLLKNMERFPEFMENVKQVTLLEGRGDRTITEWEIDLDSIAIIWKQENIFDDRQMSIRFKMLEGDFGRYEGEWNLFGLLTGTEIQLTIVVDWGAPALARYIEDVLKKKTQDTLEGMLNGIKRKLWIENIPQLLKFAFIIHPYDLDVISVAFNEPDCNNERRHLLEKMFEWFPTFACSHVVGTRSLTGKEIDGELIYCPLLPNQVLNLDSNFVLRKVIEAAEIAERQGAKILGLGAYIAGIGRRGTLVANNIDIPVTTGTSYTIAIVIEAILEAARRIGIRLSDADVVIIGATGAVGSVCSQILADSVVNLTLVARHKEKLKNLAYSICNNSAARVKTASQINRSLLKNADIIVMTTNTPGTLFDIQLLKPGAIIYDISVPKNVSKEAADLRQDILVIDGGVVKPPGDVNFNFYFGLPFGLCYACMAETMILTLEERFECYSIGGNISLAKVREVSQLGAKHGFKLAELRSFGREIFQSQIEEVKYYRLRTK